MTSLHKPLVQIQKLFHINVPLSYKALYQKFRTDSAKPNKMATRAKNRKLFYNTPCSLYCSNDSTMLNKSASRAKYSDEEGEEFY